MVALVNKTIPCSTRNFAPLRIGMRGGPLFSNYFKGVIDDLIVYGRGLTKKEVMVLASGDYSINSVSSYKLDLSNIALTDTFYFEDNVFELTEQQQKDLIPFKRKLIESKHYHVVIEGHTNGIPSHAFCDKLSLERANVVHDYLTSEGIECHKLIAKGMGKRFPIASNNNIETRKLNQRAVVRLYKLEL